MAKSGGLDQRFYVQGNDLSGDIASLDTLSATVNLLEAPTIDKTSMQRLRGLSDGAIDFTSWFDDAAGQAHPVLSALPTTDVILLHAFGSAQGAQAASLVAKQINYAGSRGPDAAFPFTVNTQAAAGVPIEFMEMFTSFLDTIASSGQTASKDDSAGTSDGLAAVLQVNEIDSGTPTVILEDSPNDSTWATLISFAAVADGSEPTAERLTVTGNVDRFLRVNVTGTFTNLDFALAYRRGEAVDVDPY